VIPVAKALGYGLLGIAALLFVKYGVVGVRRWNCFWHVCDVCGDDHSGG